MTGRVGLDGGYVMRFFVALPLTIFMLHVRRPMYAFVVASHGLPNINGCPSSLLLMLITRKSTGYSQESTRISISCNVSSSLTTDISTSYNIIEVGSKEVIPRMLQVSMVRMLLDAPKSTSVFGKKHPYI
jgi:hypothetical protein